MYGGAQFSKDQLEARADAFERRMLAPALQAEPAAEPELTREPSGYTAINGRRRWY